MPITDLDGRYRPQRLGKVRLGRTKEKTVKGKVINIPYATEYFVIDGLSEEIKEEYGEEPTTLLIEFLFNSIDHVFPHYHQHYLRRGLRCMGDGDIVLYRAGGKVEEPIVYIKNGAIAEHIEDAILKEWATQYGTTDPMGNSLRCLGFDCPSSKPGECRPRGRLCFAIQGHAALGYYEMSTGSINAIAGIVGQLQLALSIFGHIDAMPWNLHLRPETMQVNGKSMKIYVPWIEIQPPWLQRNLPRRGLHLRATEEQRRADIADLYGDEDTEALDFDPTPRALLEAAKEEQPEEETASDSREAIMEAEAVVDEYLEEIEEAQANENHAIKVVQEPWSLFWLFVNEHEEVTLEDAQAVLQETGSEPVEALKKLRRKFK